MSKVYQSSKKIFNFIGAVALLVGVGSCSTAQTTAAVSGETDGVYYSPQKDGKVDYANNKSAVNDYDIKVGGPYFDANGNGAEDFYYDDSQSQTTTQSDGNAQVNNINIYNNGSTNYSVSPSTDWGRYDGLDITINNYGYNPWWGFGYNNYWGWSFGWGYPYYGSYWGWGWNYPYYHNPYWGWYGNYWNPYYYGYGYGYGYYYGGYPWYGYRGTAVAPGVRPGSGLSYGNGTPFRSVSPYRDVRTSGSLSSGNVRDKGNVRGETPVRAVRGGSGVRNSETVGNQTSGVRNGNLTDTSTNGIRNGNVRASQETTNQNNSGSVRTGNTGIRTQQTSPRSEESGVGSTPPVRQVRATPPADVRPNSNVSQPRGNIGVGNNNNMSSPRTTSPSPRSGNMSTPRSTPPSPRGNSNISTPRSSSPSMSSPSVGGSRGGGSVGGGVRSGGRR